MKTKVVVDGQDAAKKVLHLKGSTFRVVVTARGDNGEPITFEPGRVSAKLGDDEKRGPETALRRVELSKLKLKRSGKLSVAVDDEIQREVVLLTRRAGWLWIFGLGITLVLATGLVVFQLAFMRFDNVLQRLEESSARVIEFMTGGLAVVLGASVVHESVVDRSWTPLLRRRRFVLPAAAFVVVLMLVPVRCATYTNCTGGPLTLNGIPAWQPGDLRFLIGDDEKVASPLCLVAEGDSACRTFGRRHLYEAVLASKQIGCRVWWPKPGSDVTESPSESCTRVKLVREHLDGRNDEVTMDYETGVAAAGTSGKIYISDKRIVITRAGTGPGNSTTPLPDDVRITSNVPVAIELRPEYANEALAARVVVAVDSSIARQIDGALLGSRFTATVRAPGSKEDFGRFSYNGVDDAGPAREPSRDKDVRPYVQLEVHTIEPRIAALTVWVDDDRVGEWTGSDDAPVVTWAVPHGVGGPSPVDFQLRMSTTWPQIRPWSLELPGSVHEVIVENAKGISLGKARAPRAPPPPAGFVLQARHVETAPKYLPLSVVDFAEETDDDAKVAWRDLGGDQSSGIGRWLWTLSPNLPGGHKALEYLAPTNGCGNVPITRSANGTLSCLKPICFVDRYAKMIGTSCPRGKKPKPWNEDERRYRPVRAPSCCSEVKLCE